MTKGATISVSDVMELRSSVNQLSDLQHTIYEALELAEKQGELDPDELPHNKQLIWTAIARFEMIVERLERVELTVRQGSN